MVLVYVVHPMGKQRLCTLFLECADLLIFPCTQLMLVGGNTMQQKECYGEIEDAMSEKCFHLLTHKSNCFLQASASQGNQIYSCWPSTGINTLSIGA